MKIQGIFLILFCSLVAASRCTAGDFINIDFLSTAKCSALLSSKGELVELGERIFEILKPGHVLQFRLRNGLVKSARVIGYVKSSEFLVLGEIESTPKGLGRRRHSYFKKSFLQKVEPESLALFAVKPIRAGSFTADINAPIEMDFTLFSRLISAAQKKDPLLKLVYGASAEKELSKLKVKALGMFSGKTNSIFIPRETTFNILLHELDHHDQSFIGRSIFFEGRSVPQDRTPLRQAIAQLLVRRGYGEDGDESRSNLNMFILTLKEIDAELGEYHRQILAGHVDEVSFLTFGFKEEREVMLDFDLYLLSKNPTIGRDTLDFCSAAAILAKEAISETLASY